MWVIDSRVSTLHCRIFTPLLLQNLRKSVSKQAWIFLAHSVCSYIERIIAHRPTSHSQWVEWGPLTYNRNVTVSTHFWCDCNWLIQDCTGLVYSTISRVEQNNRMLFVLSIDVLSPYGIPRTNKLISWLSLLFCSHIRGPTIPRSLSPKMLYNRNDVYVLSEADRWLAIWRNVFNDARRTIGL